VTTIDTRDPLARAVVEAIRSGDLPALKLLLDENPAGERPSPAAMSLARRLGSTG
jgi:hypothetical protein